MEILIVHRKSSEGGCGARSVQATWKGTRQI